MFPQFNNILGVNSYCSIIRILDNDIVVVHKTPSAENGQIVVAMIDNEATVKRFYKENGYVRLQPENDTFQPIITDECSILGRVISVVRYY